MADWIKLPTRRAWHTPTHPRPGPTLIQGRGLERRRIPSLPMAEAFTWLVAAVVAAGMLALFLLFGL